MTTTEPMTVARQLAMLVGEEKALTAIEAGWRAIRGINSESPQPIVHPGAADYVATAAILAAVEAGLADPTELTAERDAAQRESGDMAGELTNAWAALNRAGFQSPVDGVAELIDQMSAALTQSRQQAATYANEIGALKADLERMRAERADDNLRLREQVYAQKPVIDAALNWAEMCEDGGLAPDDCRQTEDALHDAVESYRLMDLALTSAREEKVAEPSEPQYLIWSNHHKVWWAPNSRGYRSNVNDAGRYALADAQKEMSRGCDCCQVPEVPVLAELTAGAGDRKLRSVIAAATKAAIEAGQVNRYYAPVIEVAS